MTTKNFNAKKMLMSAVAAVIRVHHQCKRRSLREYAKEQS